MKIKTISAEIRLVRHYQTYAVSLTAELEDNEDAMEKTRELQAKARKLAKEQLDLDSPVLK